MTRVIVGYPPPEAEDLLCHALMPPILARTGDQWATLHEVVHPRAAAIVAELQPDEVDALLRAVHA